MKTISVNTKQGANFYDSYKNSNAHALWQIYGRHSTAKECAYRDCRKWYFEENGRDFRIISYNSNTFTVGWITDEGLRVETAYNSYLIKL